MDTPPGIIFAKLNTSSNELVNYLARRFNICSDISLEQLLHETYASSKKSVWLENLSRGLTSYTNIRTAYNLLVEPGVADALTWIREQRAYSDWEIVN
jgi:hypothetical protein